MKEEKRDMSTIQPKGEQMRKAVRWVSEHMKEDAGREIGPLLQEASLRFNLSPKEEAFLREFYEAS